MQIVAQECDLHRQTAGHITSFGAPQHHFGISRTAPAVATVFGQHFDLHERTAQPSIAPDARSTVTARMLGSGISRANRRTHFRLPLIERIQQVATQPRRHDKLLSCGVIRQAFSKGQTAVLWQPNMTFSQTWPPLAMLLHPAEELASLPRSG